MAHRRSAPMVTGLKHIYIVDIKGGSIYQMEQLEILFWVRPRNFPNLSFCTPGVDFKIKHAKVVICPQVVHPVGWNFFWISMDVGVWMTLNGFALPVHPLCLSPCLTACCPLSLSHWSEYIFPYGWLVRGLFCWFSACYLFLRIDCLVALVPTCSDHWLTGRSDGSWLGRFATGSVVALFVSQPGHLYCCIYDFTDRSVTMVKQKNHT